ncbi:family 1 glycosylhydrolase [Nonomuraea sp. NPDC050153]|uniref:family 1 glycosylhydrolase n=1 Tax=Nonomuraea sp. NPDC050153 TaxID=3364359 RepID=UPI00379A45CB
MAGSGDRVLSDTETVRLIVEEARLAESVGLDVFSVGEHYRQGHNDSAAPVLLAVIATVVHWSALDNYEWGSYRPTFGLIAWDKDTFERTPKPSAAWLGEIARTSVLSHPDRP